jgi:hypothetical protein
MPGQTALAYLRVAFRMAAKRKPRLGKKRGLGSKLATMDSMDYRRQVLS